MAVERWAIVVNNAVENICLWDGVVYSPENPSAWQPPDGAVMVNVENMPCGIGWFWNGTSFEPPAAAVDPAADGS